MTEPDKNPSRTDWALAWKMYKTNAKAFIGFGIFAIVGTFVFITGVLMVFLLLLVTILEALHMEITREFIYSVAIFAVFPQTFLMLAFIGCEYGLSHDIISSGDEFTQFKSAFTYFRRFWWQYGIGALWAGMFNLIFVNMVSPVDVVITPDNALFFFLRGCLFYLLGYFWNIAFVTIMPSITAQGNLKDAFRESWQILRTNGKRLYKTGMYFYLLIGIPNVVSMELYYFVYPITTIAWQVIIMIAFISTTIINLAIGNPLLALSMTRLYVTVKIPARAKTISEKQKEVKIEPKF